MIRHFAEKVWSVSFMPPLFHKGGPRATPHLCSEWKQTESNHRAKFYRITAAGKKQLASDLSRWQQIVGAVTAILEREPGGGEA